MIHFKHSLNNMNLAFMAASITELYFETFSGYTLQKYSVLFTFGLPFINASRLWGN